MPHHGNYDISKTPSCEKNKPIVDAGKTSKKQSDVLSKKHSDKNVKPKPSSGHDYRPKRQTESLLEQFEIFLANDSKVGGKVCMSSTTDICEAAIPVCKELSNSPYAQKCANIIEACSAGEELSLDMDVCLRGQTDFCQAEAMWCKGDAAKSQICKSLAKLC